MVPGSFFSSGNPARVGLVAQRAGRRDCGPTRLYVATMEDDQYYTEKAQAMRDIAERAASPEARAEFLKLAREYELLAESAGEKRPPRRQI
jgi:hypothetical protein